MTATLRNRDSAASSSSPAVPIRNVGFASSAMRASSFVFLLCFPPMTTIASTVESWQRTRRASWFSFVA